MKNRLQFNRIPTLYTSGETMVSGTTIGVSGRDKANSALTEYITRRDFIPLIGEPIVVRYIDDKGKKQLILAVGKATGQTANDTYGIEYHRIDTAKLTEDVDLANENAAEALELASAATKDTADYLTILKNMIVSGVGLSDGSYFDNNGRWDRDPSQVGLYDPIENANYIADAVSFRDADDKLDKALKNTDDNLAELSGATEDLSGTTKGYLERIIAAAGLNEQEPGEYPGHDETHFIKDATSLDNADVLLDAAIWDLSADTYNTIAELSAGTIQLSADTVAAINELSAGTIQLSADTVAAIEQLSADTVAMVKELSAGTIQLSADTKATIDEFSGVTGEFSATTKTLFDNVIEAEGLKEDGTYDHERAHNSVNFKDAFDAFKADELLDSAITALSANTMAADEALNDKIEELSANTMAVIEELSANTMAADQALQDQIDELDNRRVLGVSAITVETLENGDSKVSLLINEEDDKVLTQNTLGLKANVSLVYAREDKKIYLKGKNDVVISEINADDFIKDGMLSAASVFTATEADHEQYPELVVGKTYIKLLFNTDGEEPGRANPVFISAEDLVDIYTVAPESYTYMTINDYVISLNVDQDNGLASYNYARNISAVTTNIVEAAGLNMGEQGGYPGHDETHYIKHATSLDNADVLLDEALWELSGNTSSMFNEMGNDLAELSSATQSFSSSTVEYFDRIITAAGLNTQDPGEYPGHDETHYIKDATSLDNADTLLDAALWETSGLIADISNRLDDLSGVTESLSAHTVEALSALSQSVDERIESAITVISGMVEERLSGFTDQIYEYVDNAVEELSGNILEYVYENEEVTAGALNDLNDRVMDIETHMTGEYIPLTNYVISSGLTEEELIVDEDDTVNEAFGKIQKQILDNEEAIAAALNNLNVRVENAGDELDDLDSDLKQLSGAVRTFSAATNQSLIAVNERTTILSGVVSEFSSATHTRFMQLSGAVQSISAKTSGVLTINANGVEQGKYSPSANTTIDLQIIQEVTGADVLLTGYEIATGTTEEELVVVATDTVNEAFGKVQKQIYDNETVIAGSLNDLNSRIITMSGDIQDIRNEVDNLTGETITGITVNGVPQVVSGRVVELHIEGPGSTYTAGSGINISNEDVISAKLANKGDTNYLKLDGEGIYLSGVSKIRQDVDSLSASVIDDEKVIAAAFNDLNRRVAELSANTSGGGSSEGPSGTYVSTNTVTGLTFSNYLTVVQIAGQGTGSVISCNVASVGLPELPANGVKEAHVIIENTSSSNVARIRIDSSDARLKFTMGNEIYIEPNGIGELNAMITYDGSNYTIYIITT